MRAKYTPNWASFDSIITLSTGEKSGLIAYLTRSSALALNGIPPRLQLPNVISCLYPYLT